MLRASDKQLVDNASVNIGQAKVAPLVGVRDSGVIEPQQMQHRRMHVVKRRGAVLLAALCRSYSWEVISTIRPELREVLRVNRSERAGQVRPVADVLRARVWETSARFGVIRLGSADQLADSSRNPMPGFPLRT